MKILNTLLQKIVWHNRLGDPLFTQLVFFLQQSHYILQINVHYLVLITLDVHISVYTERFNSAYAKYRGMFRLKKNLRIDLSRVR